MKLISVTIHNYKVHEHLHIDFDAARNVLGAPNESGKSTVVEAIHHAFFLRSRVTGVVQKSMLSEMYPGQPTVELRFQSKQREYTITKIFSGSQSASTTLQQHSSEGRTLRNEEAEEMIHDLLQAEEIGGGRNLDARLRMQWAHLWIWQGTATDNPLEHANVDQHAASLRNRLAQTEGGGVLESTLDATVSGAIKQRCHSTFTEKGRPRSGSSLDRAHKDLQAAVLDHDQAKKTFNLLEDSLETIRCSEQTIASCATQQESLIQELEDISRRQRNASDLKVRIAEEQAALSHSQDLHAEALRSDKAITDCEKEIHLAEERVGPHVSTLDNLKACEKEHEIRLGQTTHKLSEAGQRQVTANSELAIYDVCEKYERLRAERKALSHRCDQIAHQRKHLQKLHDEQDCVPELSKKDLSELLQRERDYELAEATLDAIATKIELIQTSESVLLKGEVLTIRAPVTISSEAELVIEHGGGTVTKMRVSPGGGRSLAEAMQRSQDAKIALEAALMDAGFDSLNAARKAYVRHQSLDADIHAIRLTIDGLGGAEAEADLRHIDAKIRKTTTDLSHRVAEGFIQPKNLGAAQEKQRAAEMVLIAAREAVAKTSEEVDALRNELSAIVQQRMSTEGKLHEEKAELASLNARLQIMKERFGSDRRSHIQELAHQVHQCAEKLEASQRKLSKMLPEDLERDKQRIERTLSLLTSKKQDAETAKQVARARLDFGGTTDPRADLARAVVHHELVLKEHARAVREAEAVKLLAGLFSEKKQEVESQFVAPLTDRVRDYLVRLYGEGTDVGVDYDGGCFHRLSLSRQAGVTATFEFSQLSSGAKEQVSAAFRLAMAEVLAQDHDGCLPIIFDDAFVNADMDRQRAIQRLLDLAASRGLQVIVLSCRPDNYVNLGAKQITLEANPFAKVWV